MADMKIGDEIFNVEVEAGRRPVLILSNSLGSNLHMWGFRRCRN